MVEQEEKESLFGVDEAPPDNRHGARQLALQALYWDAFSPGDVEESLRHLVGSHALSDPVRGFAADIIHGVGAHAEELEELINATATRWRKERIARIDWIILQLALTEILYFADIPVRVSIDEAVELAKTYSTEQSYAFINGILDAIVRQKGLPL
jgi:N utilization substance protein B